MSEVRNVNKHSNSHKPSLPYDDEEEERKGKGDTSEKWKESDGFGPDPLSLELANNGSDDMNKNGGVDRLALGKRRSDHQISDGDRKCFAVSSYDSAFLEDIFDDIAHVGNSSESDEANTEGTETQVNGSRLASAPDLVNNSKLIATKSEHNLAKRRLVSTNKSLERCGRSSYDLAAASLPVVCPYDKKYSSPFLSSRNTNSDMDLPATVSASHSFQQELTSSTSMLRLSALDRALMYRKVQTKKSTAVPKDEADFGWYIDTDFDDEDTGPSVTAAADPYAASSVPLAFTAPTAPRSPSKNHQAEVEWAQAADTIDEVLGDFF